MSLSIYLFFWLEILGTVAFAISGAMVAIEKRTDLFGVLVLGILTATGGGMLRDVLLGNLPPRIFSNGLFVGIAATSSLLLFFVARRYQTLYVQKRKAVDQINNFFDALGRGSFTVTGIQIGIASGFGDSHFFLIFLGVLTGVGGGIIRDLMVTEIPFVLRERIYAVAALSGGFVYVCLTGIIQNDLLPSLLSIATTVTLRFLATFFRWHLPRAIP